MAKTDTLFGAYSVRAGARFLQGHIRPAQLTVHPSAPREPRGGVTFQLLLPATHLKLPASKSANNYARFRHVEFGTKAAVKL